ncbi:hypothetical protein ElyMa_002049000 [Elysia marginata]|uniref:C-type lectin domain-containing protein n=1 Tax=Elysia marginata TaxID=1093978 RepID=A0AAV4F9N8_9GAST|nr:hypothetical protein ElyMa_002049000 [Elysia marginata]
MGFGQISCFCKFALLLLRVYLASGVNMFEFHLLDTKHRPSVGTSLCKELGYDGLAVLSSPEAYKVALEMTAPKRTSETSRVAVGLVYQSNPRSIRWANGEIVADDFPWNESPPRLSAHWPFGRMMGNGKFTMTANAHESPILCGRYDSKESFGKTRFGQQPDGQSSNLARNVTDSLMGCIVLCGGDGRCRAAEFNFNLSVCTTFGAGMFSGFAENNATITFVRDGFTV